MTDPDVCFSDIGLGCPQICKKCDTEMIEVARRNHDEDESDSDSGDGPDDCTFVCACPSGTYGDQCEFGSQSPTPSPTPAPSLSPTAPTLSPTSSPTTSPSSSPSQFAAIRLTLEGDINAAEENKLLEEVEEKVATALNIPPISVTAFVESVQGGSPGKGKGRRIRSSTIDIKVIIAPEAFNPEEVLAFVEEEAANLTTIVVDGATFDVVEIVAPTMTPTVSPSKSPTKFPTTSPSTSAPTSSPTTSEPTTAPTPSPTTTAPTPHPTPSPTPSPTYIGQTPNPTPSPTTTAPTPNPTPSPTTTAPTPNPTPSPTTTAPTPTPTPSPTTTAPTPNPTPSPTTTAPTPSPTPSPTTSTPTPSPTPSPTTSSPTMSPTVSPTRTAYTSVDGRIGCSSHETTAPIVTVDRCNEAAEYLGLAVTEATVSKGRSRQKRPFGCYFDEELETLQLNLDGSQEQAALVDANAFRYTLCFELSPLIAPTTQFTGTTEPRPTDVSGSLLPTPAPTPAPITPSYVLTEGRCVSKLAEVSLQRECEIAAAELGLEDTTATINALPSRTKRPIFCYYDKRRKSLQFNPSGTRVITTGETHVSICRNSDNRRR